MSQELVLVAYALLFVVSIVQIIAAAKAITLGNDISDSATNVYSIMYSTEAGYYLAVGITTILLTALLIFQLIYWKASTFLIRLGEFLIILLVLCLQAALATYSAINATVLSSSSDNFSTFSNLKCSFVSLRDIITAIAVINWVLVCPMLIVLLNWGWSEWKKSLEKEAEAEPEEPSARDSLNN